jgi:hypothetical protein
MAEKPINLFFLGSYDFMSLRYIAERYSIDDW